jgi:hypothetical protein
MERPTESRKGRLGTRHSTAQHSTAQHSTAQHSTAQHSTAQHSTARPAPPRLIMQLLRCAVLTLQLLGFVVLQPWAPYTDADGPADPDLCRTVTTPAERKAKQDGHIWDCQLPFLNCETCKAAFAPEEGAPAPTFKSQAPTEELLEAIRWKARNNAAKEA